MEETKETSTPLAAQVWKELQVQLKHETSPYLALDKFTLQKDSYTRLFEDDVVEIGEPWLQYNHLELKSDESLPFGLYFFGEGFELIIGVASFECTYAGYGYGHTQLRAWPEDKALPLDARATAKNIILTIKLLLSGQIAQGYSVRGHHLLAVETFILGFETKPFPIAISGEFTWFRQTALDYNVKQNRLLNEKLSVPETFPLLPPVINGERLRSGRTMDSLHGQIPLTRKMFKDIETNMILHDAGGKLPSQGIWESFYTSIEFWLAVVLVLTFILWLKFSPQTPGLFHDPWMQVVYMISAPLLIGLVFGFLTMRRQRALETGRHTPLVRSIQWIGNFGPIRLLLVVTCLAMIPIILYINTWTPIGDYQHLYKGIEILNTYPQLYGFVGGTLLLAVIVSSKTLVLHKLGRWLVAALTIMYTVSFYTFNQLTMNTSDQAPKPDEWTMTIVLLTPAVMVILGVALGYGKPRSKNAH